MKTFPYDVFLSYAVEDKLELASELCQKLEQRGLNVWYAGRELVVGNSIEKTILEGLERSRFGIVLITSTYFEKKWTLKELYTLMARESENLKIIIPVFHRITPDEVAIHDKLLSERWALSTEMGMDRLADEIISRIRKEPLKDPKSHWKKYILLGILALFIALTGWYFFSDKSITEEQIQEAIHIRVDAFQKQVDNQMKTLIDDEYSETVNQKDVIKFTNHFTGLEVQYRNYYEFTNGFQEIQFLKYVGPATGIDFESWSPANNYGFEYPNIYMVEQPRKQPYFDKAFVYFNTQDADPVIDHITNQDSVMVVTVTYAEPIRLVSFHYEYTPQTSYRKHTTYTIKGFLPMETYVFARKGKEWTLREVK